MNRINLGKVRGTSIYTGEAITGTNSLGAVFVDTGISEGYVGDLYINTKANTEDCGNVYECLQSGTAAEAVWGYKGNIRGPQVILDDTLESTSRTKALSAYQGKVLNEKIVNSGCYAKSIPVVNDAVVHGIKVILENESTTVTVTIGGKELSGTYEKNENGTEGSVTIVAGTDAGVVTQISSTDAYIKSYTLYDSSSEEIFSEELKVWDYVGELMEDIASSGSVVDGAETIKTGILSKMFGGVRKILYPITHAKAVWFDKAENKTVYDAVTENAEAISAVNANSARMVSSVFVAGNTSVVVHNAERYDALICYGTLGNVGTTIFGIMLNDGEVELYDICGKSVISSITVAYDNNAKAITLSFGYYSSFRVLYYRPI